MSTAYPVPVADKAAGVSRNIGVGSLSNQRQKYQLRILNYNCMQTVFFDF
jgi:hypothetical protein